MNTTNIDNLISALRAETEKNSISPERVGYILRLAIDLLSQHDADNNLHIPADRNLSLNSVTANSVIADREDDGVVLSSSNFDGTSALAGFGYGIMKDGFDYRLAIDYLTVRKGMTVAELVIQEYKSVGGVLVLSACNGEAEQVIYDSTDEESGEEIYYINIKDWDKHPMFDLGDMVRCSRWDLSKNELVSYIGVVENDVTDYQIHLRIKEGNGIPQVGDNLVQFGNATDKNRQGLIILSTEQGIPNISVYDGVTDGNITPDKLTARLGDLTGLTDADGNALSGYGLWTNSLYLGSSATETFTELVNSIVGDLPNDVTDLQNALLQYQASTEAKFTANEQKFESLQGTTYTLVHNLLQKTNQGNTGWSTTPIGKFETASILGSGNINYVAINKVDDSESSWEAFLFDLNSELIVNGKTYLLSFDVLQRNVSADETAYNQADGIAIRAGILQANGANVLAPLTAERNGLTTVFNSWVRMEYELTATDTGLRDAVQKIYLSVLPIDSFARIDIKNLQLVERISTANTVDDSEFVEWRPAVEDTALDYADVVAEEAKNTAIQQTKDEINIGAYAKTTFVDGAIEDAKSEIKITTDGISSTVSELETDVNGQISGLQSEITQTADKISLKVNEMGISGLNHAYGTGTRAEITTFDNFFNQTKNLYKVTGLTGGETISVSFLIRIKNIIFDAETATANDRKSAIYFQLDASFGYQGFNCPITADTFADATADDEGYLNARINIEGVSLPQYQWVDGMYNDDYPITPDTDGYVYIKLDYIDSETEEDDDGNAVDIGSILIEQLKIERGEECTAWTARTQDLDTALLATGIDIENQKISVTANQFEVRNNFGDITASVDKDGRLTSNMFIAKEGQYKRATLNEDFNGFGRWYYPGTDITCVEVGWDENLSSFIRTYDKEGNMTWKLDTTAAFGSPTNNVWVDVELCPLGLDYAGAKTQIITPQTLTMTPYFEINRAGAYRTYSIKDNNYDYETYGITGYFTAMSEAKNADVEGSGKYYRTLRYYEAGKLISSEDIIFYA